MSFKVTIEDAELNRYLDTLNNRIKSPGPVLKIIGRVIERNTELRFDTKKDPEGNAWEPHAPKTAKAYAKQDAGRKQGSLLQRTGLMRDSLSHSVAGNTVAIGFGRVIAKYHETGTPKMPRRAMLTANYETGTLGNADIAAVIKALNKHLAV